MVSHDKHSEPFKFVLNVFFTRMLVLFGVISLHFGSGLEWISEASMRKFKGNELLILTVFFFLHSHPKNRIIQVHRLLFQYIQYVCEFLVFCRFCLRFPIFFFMQRSIDYFCHKLQDQKRISNKNLPRRSFSFLPKPSSLCCILFSISWILVHRCVYNI